MLEPASPDCRNDRFGWWAPVVVLGRGPTCLRARNCYLVSAPGVQI